MTRSRACSRKIVGTTERAAKTRERLCRQLASELLLHAHAEESHFYPALKRHPETKDFVTEALNEHKQVERMIHKVEKIAADDPQFLEQIEELQRMVQHHVHEEEEEIFPAAKDALSSEESRTILHNIKEMKKEKKAA